MALRFILGRAGAGKTHACLDAVRAACLAEPEGPPVVLLVPEQATFQVEQALVGNGGLKGIMRAQVLSFQRLAWRVSQKAGGLQHPPLSEVGKAMVLRALLANRQQELRLFGQVADRPGFITKLSGTISEMRTYRQGPADLKGQLARLEVREEGTSTLGTKLHDLTLVMQDLIDYTRDRFTDPDDYLNVLADRLPESGVLDGAEVWVDAFTGFTPQEIHVLRAIFQTAKDVHVTLCLDPAELGRSVPRKRDKADLFHPTLTTYDQLMDLAAEVGADVAAPVALPAVTSILPRFAAAPDLGWVERQLFRALPTTWSGPAGHVAIAYAQNRREEAEAAAREVLRLVRDQGLRFREVSVVARNLDAYGDLVHTVFQEHGIPAFVDRRRTVAHHPLVELIRSALEVVLQDWSYSAVFRYLKTDLAGVERHEVDALENYVIEHGIKGKAWQDQSPWAFLRRYNLEEEAAPTDGSRLMLERINRIRSRATGELAAFHRRIGGGRGRRALTVRTVSAALFHLLDDLKVATRLEKWSTEAAEDGNLEAAREHEQVWGMVLDLLDQMVEALGDMGVTLQQYLQILSAGLDGLRLGLIPPGMDMAVVGSVERSRHSGVKATLILGATDKDFPPMPPEDVIFTDREREQLDDGGLEIGPTSVMRLFQEQFFTYVALTRGSTRLWLSYPLADESGRAVTPSPVVRRLRQLFPAVTPQPAGGESGAPGTVGAAAAAVLATPARFGAALAEAMRLHRSGYALHPLWLELYQWAALDPGLRERVAPVMSALRYEESYRQKAAPLGPDLARSLYGSILTTSVSRLESFTACPFQHFGNHGLRLRERAQFQVSAPELGVFYHAALSMFVRDLMKEGRAWTDLSQAEATQRLDALVDQLAPRLHSQILLSTPQYRYILRVMRRTLQSSLRFLGDHVHKGDFQPLWVELPFGSEENGLPSVEFPLENEGLVRLRGRIDRVDGMKAPDGAWLLRVMDYKSSPRPLDLTGFYHGLTLQLLLYLYAVVGGAGAMLGQVPTRPAGAIYFPVYDPLEKLDGPRPAEVIEQQRRKKYKATGILTADPDVLRAMDREGLGLTQARLTKQGTVYKGAPVADEHQFAKLFTHLRRTVRKSAAGLLEGGVDVAPYRLGKDTPCPNCSLRSVCQFDPQVKGQEYRTLDLMKPADVWQRLLLEEGGEDGDE